MKKLLLIIFIMIISPICVFAKEKTSHINVAFTIDNNYPIMTLIAIDSILDRNKSNSEYTFYIIENNMTDKNKEMMKSFVEKKKQKIEIINVNTSKIDNGQNLFSYSNRITPIAFARILLPELLPDSVHKVLYLDADILVTSDLKKLYDTNINSYFAGMVLSHSQDNGALFLYKFKHGYYNSGVILLNLDKCRKEKSIQTMLSFLKRNKARFICNENACIGGWRYPDQDLINVVWDGKIKSLPINWNNQCIKGSCMTNEATNGGILHYIGPDKPWDYKENLKFTPYNQFYYLFLNSSELSKYKYYFAYKKAITVFQELIIKKFNRYKKLIHILSTKPYKEQLYLLFYVDPKIKL